MAAKYYRAVDGPEDFPNPPGFGIHRTNSRTFTIHNTLSLVKSAITNEVGWDDDFRYDYKVYEYVDGEWCLIYEMTKGDKRSQHTLWQAPAPKTAGISEKATDKAVAEAIASLTNTNGSTT